MALQLARVNYLEISSCNSSSAGGTWGTLTTADSEYYKYGTASLSGILKASGNNDVTFTPSSAIDLSGVKHVRWWMVLLQGSKIDLMANGGIQFWASDGTNTGYWYVGGRDTYPGGWFNFVIDVSRSVDAGTKPTAMNAITSMGFRVVLTSTAKNATNTWVDHLCYCDGINAYDEHDTGAITIGANASGTYTRSSGDYTTDGFKPGMQIVISGFANSGNNGTKYISTVTSTVITVTDATGMVTESGTGDERIKGFFDEDDVWTADELSTSYCTGVSRNLGGVHFRTGSTRYGIGTGSTNTKYQTKSKVIVYEDRRVNSSLYDISEEDNGSGTTEVYWGSKSGTGDSAKGIEGCVITVEDLDQTPVPTFTATDTDITHLGIYGTTFTGCGAMNFPPAGTYKEALNCNFERCGEIDGDTMKFRNCNFVASQGSTVGAVKIDTTSFDIRQSNFIGCNRAVRFPSGSQNTYDFYDLVFSNNTVDVRNEVASGQTVTINKNGTSDPSTSEEPNGGTTVFLGTKTITLTNVITGSRVDVNEDPATVYTSASSGNNAGDSDFVVQEAIAGDCPTSGVLIITDESTWKHHRLRYASKSDSTKTFTFPTKISGTTTSGGGSDTITDSGASFLSENIQYGDPVRNSTDGSWAQVISVDSDTQITTTSLQGGGDDTWESGDGYEFHTLPITCTGSDTAITPWINEVATSGTVQKSINYVSAKTLKGRVSYYSGGYKYQHYNFYLPWTSDGATLRVDQAVDGIGA